MSVLIAIGCVVVAGHIQPAFAQDGFSYKWGVATINTPPKQVDLNSLPPYVKPTQLGAEPGPPSAGQPLSASQQFRRQGGPTGPGLPDAPMPMPQSIAAPSASTTFFDGNNKLNCGTTQNADMAFAVGDDSSAYPVMQANNYCVGLFTKDGKQPAQYPKALAGLFVAGVFDVRALYDRVNRRYIIVSTQSVGTGRYWIAVSKTNDPAGVYYVYEIFMPSGGTNVFADFPRLGQDDKVIYLASNKIGTDGSSFHHEEWLLLPKSQMYAGQTFSYKFVYDTTYLGVPTDSSQPSNIWNPADRPGAAFFVASKTIKAGGGYRCQDAPCNGLSVWSISNALVGGTYAPPAIWALNVNTPSDYSVPPASQQPTKDWPLDLGDTRMSGQVGYAGGAIFAALTTRNKRDGASILRYKIAVPLREASGSLPGCATCPILKSATIADNAPLDFVGLSAFLPTTQPDAKGNALTVFNIVGPETYLSTAYSMRGTVSDFVVARKGRSTFANYRAWGDYTAVAPELRSDGTFTFWVSGGYTGDAEMSDKLTINWYTVIGRLNY